MTRYSVQSRDWIFVKGYGFLSFAKNIGWNLSSKYSQKLLDHAADALKTSSKRVIQKIAEATCDLIGNKIANKSLKTSPQDDLETNEEILRENINLQN